MEKKTVFDVIEWIKGYVKSAYADGVVIGMSGGKDSLVVAKLCAAALGNDKVYGVIMPNGEMKDISDALETCKLLEIPYTVVNINQAYNSVLESIDGSLKGLGKKMTDITTINTAPRLRMTTLYAIAGSLNYLVANTSNLSEASVGYTTKWGDNVGDFSPIANFTKTEVCEIGFLLGLPDKLVNKVPSDGLSGQSDEEKLGFSYDELDRFIRHGEKGKNFQTILKKHKTSGHKREGVVKYNYIEKNFFNGKANSVGIDNVKEENSNNTHE